MVLNEINLAYNLQTTVFYVFFKNLSIQETVSLTKNDSGIPAQFPENSGLNICESSREISFWKSRRKLYVQINFVSSICSRYFKIMELDLGSILNSYGLCHGSHIFYIQ